MDYNTNALFSDLFLIITAATIIGVFMIGALFVNIYLPFRKERKYIKMEMARSCGEREYRYWQRKLKRLYLQSIPLIGRFFK